MTAVTDPSGAPAPAMDEKSKYQKMWDISAYRAVAPGEASVNHFIAVAKPAPDSTLIDFGAGTGRGALRLAAQFQLNVTMLDFADNCLDKQVKLLSEAGANLSFIEHDLTKRVPVSAEYGYCTDVMEHIPPEDVDKVLANIVVAAQHVFFQIACEDDVMGAKIGQPLHLSVHNHAWWLEKLQSLDCAVHWSKDFGSHCMFYVTAWQNASEITKISKMNTEDSVILANVEHNLQQGYKHVSPHQTTDTEVMILGGGPSLEGQLETIRELRANGVKLITTNGTYNWALEHGLKPSAQIMVDAREFNHRFTKPYSPECLYLLASQCNPKVFEGLPKESVWLWHTGIEHIEPLLKKYSPDGWYATPGGTTVLLRALPLMRMLGYKRFHLFGCDSCLAENDAHHAYAQPENDTADVVTTVVGRRTFRAHAWMLSQAEQFLELCKFMGNEMDLAFYGDGLLKHMVETAANEAEQAEFLR